MGKSVTIVEQEQHTLDMVFSSACFSVQTISLGDGGDTIQVLDKRRQQNINNIHYT